MASDLVLSLCGVEVVATSAGALWLPWADALLVADLHLGKGATFRSAGIPVPPGGSRATLDRLSTEARRFDAASIMVLGDLWHDRHYDTTAATLGEWLDGEVAQVALVPGNHDRHALPGLLLPKLQLLADGAPLGPFSLSHAPTLDGRFTLCGHLHPQVRVEGFGRERGKLPCFWHRAHALVLPAFGDFTGGHPIRLGADEHAYVCTSEGVFELPGRRIGL